MLNLELRLKQILHPLNFFKDWTEEEFREWLYIDEYGNRMPHPREIDVLKVLKKIEPFGELVKFYDICLEELIKLKQHN